MAVQQHGESARWIGDDHGAGCRVPMTKLFLFGGVHVVGKADGVDRR